MVNSKPSSRHTHHSNGHVPEPHGSEGEPDWRSLSVGCPSRCEGLCTGHPMNEPVET